MNRFFRYALALVGTVAFAMQANAQTFTPKRGAILDGRTMLKTNLFGYAVGSYSVSLERVLGKRLSLQAGYSYMPSRTATTTLSIGEKVKELQNAQIGSQSLSVDVRLYLSRMGYGHGFYLQPYFRYENHKLSGFQLQDDRTSDGAAVGADRVHPYNISGGVKASSFGLAIGVQWLIGRSRNILIDWTILGGHYTSGGRSQFEAVYTGANATQAEQAAKDYQEDVNDFVKDIPFLKNSLQHEVVNGGGPRVADCS